LGAEQLVEEELEGLQACGVCAETVSWMAGGGRRGVLLRTMPRAHGILAEGEQLLELPAGENVLRRWRLVDYLLAFPGGSPIRAVGETLPHFGAAGVEVAGLLVQKRTWGNS